MSGAGRARALSRRERQEFKIGDGAPRTLRRRLPLRLRLSSPPSPGRPPALAGPGQGRCLPSHPPGRRVRPGGAGRPRRGGPWGEGARPLLGPEAHAGLSSGVARSSGPGGAAYARERGRREDGEGCVLLPRAAWVRVDARPEESERARLRECGGERGVLSACSSLLLLTLLSSSRPTSRPPFHTRTHTMAARQAVPKLGDSFKWLKPEV